MTNPESEYRRRIWAKAEEQKREAERERDESAEQSKVNQIVASIERLGERFDRQADENTPEKCRERKWRHAEVIGLWAAAAVGVLAIWVASHDATKQYKIMAAQQRVMQGQLDEMQIEQRAWLYPQIELGSASPQYDLTFVKIADAPSLRFNVAVPVKIQLINAGKLPALRVFVFLHLYPVAATGAIYAIGQKPPFCDGIGELDKNTGATVFPGQQKAAPPQIAHSGVVVANPADAPTIILVDATPMPESGKAHIVLSGCIKYFSGNDPKPHYTGIWGTLAEAISEDGRLNFVFDVSRGQYAAKTLKLLEGPYGQYVN